MIANAMISKMIDDINVSALNYNNSLVEYPKFSHKTNLKMNLVIV